MLVGPEMGAMAELFLYTPCFGARQKSDLRQTRPEASAQLRLSGHRYRSGFLQCAALSSHGTPSPIGRHFTRTAAPVSCARGTSITIRRGSS